MGVQAERRVFTIYGGKVRLASKIVALFPPHRLYTEAYVGGGSVFLAKPRCNYEALNDRDSRIVDVYRALRDYPEELLTALEQTPYARVEYERCRGSDGGSSCVENARRFLVVVAQSVGSTPTGTGWRRQKYPPSRNGNYAKQWGSYSESVAAFLDSFRGVYLECMDGVEFLQAYDAPGVLHYVDPPYDPAVCDSGWYDSTVDHDLLLATLLSLQGMVVLSGYASPRYQKALVGWDRVEFPVSGLGRGGVSRTDRVEVVWRNPAAVTG